MIWPLYVESEKWIVLLSFQWDVEESDPPPSTPALPIASSAPVASVLLRKWASKSPARAQPSNNKSNLGTSYYPHPSPQWLGYTSVTLINTQTWTMDLLTLLRWTGLSWTHQYCAVQISPTDQIHSLLIRISVTKWNNMHGKLPAVTCNFESFIKMTHAAPSSILIRNLFEGSLCSIAVQNRERTVKMWRLLLSVCKTIFPPLSCCLAGSEWPDVSWWKPDLVQLELAGRGGQRERRVI